MTHCARCNRGLSGEKGYTVRLSHGRVRNCLWCALRHAPMLRRSTYVAIVVGTLLTVLNQGDVLLSNGVTGAMWWKIPLTYLVPFGVATYGALANARGAEE